MIDDAPVGHAIASGHDAATLGQLVVAQLAVQHKLIRHAHHHLVRAVKLVENDEDFCVRVGWEKLVTQPAHKASGHVRHRQTLQVRRVEDGQADVNRTVEASVGSDVGVHVRLADAASSIGEDRQVGIDAGQDELTPLGGVRDAMFISVFFITAPLTQVDI